MRLTPVDKIEFLVLVDNCIEWFSALPPGFVHEVPQHLKRPPPNEPPKDPLTGLPILDFANYCCGAHGLSVLIMTTIGDKTYQVLMDGGPEHLSIERNVKAMAVELRDLDAIVLSHWHSDHSGGILKALELRQSSASFVKSLDPLDSLHPLDPLPVDLHPERPIRRGIAPLPKRIPIAVLPADPTFEQIESAGGTVRLSDEPHDIIGRDGCSTGVRVSGEIPRVEPFERGLLGAVTWMKDESGEEGWFTDEQILDERYVAVEVKGQGLVVFSSYGIRSALARICNVLTDAQTTYDRPIHMVVGGLHLVPTAQQPVVETVDFLSRRLRPTPKYVLPLHCTGLEARAMIRQAMGDACIPAGVGMRVTVEAKVEVLTDEDEEELEILD